MRVTLILFCLATCVAAMAQSQSPEFANYTSEEINLKTCPFDQDAGAMILLDEATSITGFNNQVFTHRRIRIKILDKRELDKANITIPFYAHEQFETIDSIKGVTFNLKEGEFERSWLDNEAIYTEKVDEYYSIKKFAMPAVKEGSIIEYEYNSRRKSYSGFKSWVFQSDIPTIKSCYTLQLLPFVQFEYGVQRAANYPIIIKNLSDPDRIYFEMNNIPGLKFEPYMDAAKDYLQRVDFQLAGYTTSYGLTEVNQTWKNLASNLLNHKDFGGAIKKNLSNTGEIKAIVAKEISDSGKIAAIYNYVRDNFTWNGYYSLYATNGLTTPWELRSGSGAEINLILINLLRNFDLEAYPLLAADRNYGKIDMQYPFLDRFNKVVAYAKAGKRVFIMDATQKYCPADLPPFSLLNTIGFIVDRKELKHIGILNKGYRYENNITIDAALHNDGTVRGTAKIVSTGYSKQQRTEKIKKDRKAFIETVLKEPGSELTIDNCSFSNLDDEAKPLIQEVNFHSELNVSGGFVFIIYNLFTGIEKNPFIANERFTNINFGYPYNINVTINLILPAGSKIDKLPEDKSVASPDVSTIAYRSLKLENNKLVVNIGFRQSVTLVSFKDYADTKSVYGLLTEMLNEPVIVKVAN